MQSAKIDSLSKYNSLVNCVLISDREFPGELCDFLVHEYELEATLLTKATEKGFELLGKSSNSRKSYKEDTLVKCNSCAHFNSKSTATVFDVNANCEISASDVVMNEGCLHISISGSERVMLKIAKKNESSKSDIDDIIVIGNSLRNILRLW